MALALRLAFFNGLNWDDDPDYVARTYQVMKGDRFIFPDNNGFRIGTYYPAAIPYALFGINDFACGFYALIVSLLSVVAAYKLGALLFNARTGLIAALLLAFYPLDVELASRLMPDGLLSGFSLFAMYFLFKGDRQNLKSESPSLQSAWSYALCGLLLGWCTLVNMSAVVLVLFAAIYFLCSLPAFQKKIKPLGFVNGFIKIFVLRYAILTGAFLLVAALEGISYYKVTGDFLFKYHNTLSHYAGEHGFCKDLYMYPTLMFHISKAGKFSFQGIEGSIYGFYYLVALPAFIYGLIRYRSNGWYPALWLAVVFCYLQWGSMSFTQYIPFHRLARHLSIATPPMVLCIAFFLGTMRPGLLRKILAPVFVLFLVISSLIFNYYRHEHLIDSVLPQAAIHEYFEQLKPKYVYAANNTTAYQKFLDRFQDRGRHYVDIRAARGVLQKDAYAVIGEFRNWHDVVRDVLPNPYNIPVNWKLEKTLTVEGLLDRPPYSVRIYKLLNVPIAKLELEKSKELLAFLQRTFPQSFKPDTQLVLSWECARLDGIDELTLRGDNLTNRHIEFNQPEEITYKVFTAIPRDAHPYYRILKERGRGDVSITEAPSKENGFALRIKINDGNFPSCDFYRFFLVADKSPPNSAP
jgi:hypothetical protein